MHCAATSSFWNAPQNMVISNWIWTLSGFGACAVWGDLKLLGHFQVLERFIFINVSAINNSKHSHNSPSLFFPDLNFYFFKIFFLKWRISFPSFTKSFADWKQDTYLIIFRCHVNWSWAESNPARCYALCFLFFQKPQTCVFENMSLSKKALSHTHRVHMWGWLQAHTQTCLFKEATESTHFTDLLWV